MRRSRYSYWVKFFLQTLYHFILQTFALLLLPPPLFFLFFPFWWIFTYSKKKVFSQKKQRFFLQITQDSVFSTFEGSLPYLYSVEVCNMVFSLFLVFFLCCQFNGGSKQSLYSKRSIDPKGHKNCFIALAHKTAFGFDDTEFCWSFLQFKQLFVVFSR